MSNPQAQRGDDIAAAEERARVHVQAEKLSELLMLLRDIKPFLPLPGCVERQETAEYLDHLHRCVDAALVTEYQRDLMCHACGVGSRDPYYRDYFAASPDSRDDREWSDLVLLGMAEVRREPTEQWSPLRIYGVTDVGKQFLKVALQPGSECFK